MRSGFGVGARRTFGAAALVLICGCAAAENAAAPNSGGLVVTDARITGGRLIVSGLTAKARKLVKLDNTYGITSGANRKFTFSLAAYHPANCIVTLTAAAAMTTAVVEGCASGLAARGAWSGGAKYAPNDLVTYLGSTWRAKAANANKVPDAYPTIWERFASRGDTGATGSTGPQGPTGPQGATGAAGSKGDKGDKGDQGATGAAGPGEYIVNFWQSGGVLASQTGYQFMWNLGSYSPTNPLSLELRASLPIGYPAGGSAIVSFAACYRNSGDTNPPTALYYQSVQIQPNTSLVLTANSFFNLPPGDYEIGFCVDNESGHTLQMDKLGGELIFH